MLGFERKIKNIKNNSLYLIQKNSKKTKHGEN